MRKFSLLLILMSALIYQETLAQRLTERKVRKLLDQSSLMQEHFVGFMLQEEGGRIVFAQNEDRHFVPASNTKLLTLYAGLLVLGDSIPAFHYEVVADSLILWATGDPSFLHPKLDNGRVFDFLANTPFQIFLAEQKPISFEPSYWRSDPALFPIYANTVSIRNDSAVGLEVIPRSMNNFIRPDSSLLLNNFDIVRSKAENLLIYPSQPIPDGFQDRVPFPMDLEMSRYLLQDTLKRPVNLIKRSKGENIRTFYSVPSDSLYKHMMLPSDNFLAEQILILCSGLISDTLDAKKTISFVNENRLKGLKNVPVWEDGSGLSRYNLFTPRTILDILNRLEEEIGDKERLKVLLPAGGLSGTLRTAYTLDGGKPFIWAKTGSLRNMHLQSGWLETRKGKTYRFVFMNNNFVRTTPEVRAEMVRIMTHLHDHY